MNKISKELEDMMLDYIDGNLDAAQQKAFREKLRTDPALADRLAALQKTDAAMRGLDLEIPAKNFTASVMERLDQYPAQGRLSIRNGILLLSGILMVVAMAVLLLASGVFDQPASLDINNFGLAQRYLRQNIPAVSVDGKFMVNVIILLNLAIAFVVLDRAILKPYFQRRLQA